MTRYQKVQFSSLILTNQMTRGRALELLKQPLTNDEIKTEKEFVASKLKISISELENFFNLLKKHIEIINKSYYIYLTKI